ncbi:unnamed protein product [Allacma fusca]|uniref:Uncharacterized protein n=1 Tax=Allacma fusca TaxID=39272 RepID=A0A8J2KH53_9HEXA|nr:unnamed protein product [Allacma fusca]
MMKASGQRIWIFITMMLCLIALASSQGKEGYQKSKGTTKNSINSITSEDKAKTLVQSIIPGYQNSTQPFSVRFGKPPRVSQRFHYPVLPEVYWTQHKRPFVPLIEE